MLCEGHSLEFTFMTDEILVKDQSIQKQIFLFSFEPKTLEIIF